MDKKATVTIQGVTLEYLDKHRGKTPRSKYVTKVLDEHLKRIESENQYGSMPINDMLKKLKVKFKLSDFRENKKFQRFFGSHLCKIWQKLGHEEFVKRLNFIYNDDFRRSNSGSLKYIYNEIKAYVPPPEYVFVQKTKMTKEELTQKLQSGEVFLNTMTNEYEYKYN